MEAARLLDAMSCYSHAIRDLLMQRDGLGYLDHLDDAEIRGKLDQADEHMDRCLAELTSAQEIIAKKGRQAAGWEK